MKRKKCIKCGKIKLIKFFYFRKDNNKYRNECIKCLGKGKRKKIFVDFNKKLKQCTKCRKLKLFSNFYKHRTNKLKLTGECKQCRYKVIKKYRNNNKDHYKSYRRQYEQNILKNTPWILSYKSAKQRCENPNIIGYKNYGGRGIKLLITKEELKKLWFRDKAYHLKKPSLDRKNNDGHYEYNNCRYIEFIDNIKKSVGIKIYQYSLNGKLIKKWNSKKELINKFKEILKKNNNFLNYKWKTAIEK